VQFEGVGGGYMGCVRGRQKDSLPCLYLLS